MRKFIFVLIIVLFMPFNVKALYDILDPNCTVGFKTSLREEGNSLIYRFSSEADTTYTLYFYNISDNLDIVDSNGKSVSDKITGLTPGTRTTINVYASSNTSCYGYKVLTKVINVPYYNPYFGSEMCDLYKDFNLCDENINVFLAKEEFEKKLNEYKNNIKVEEDIKDVEEIINDNKKMSFFDYLYEYWLYIAFIIIIVAIFITIIVLKKNIKERGIL